MNTPCLVVMALGFNLAAPSDDALWGGRAAELERGGRLAEVAPEIARQLDLDARAPWLELWAESLNFDEHAHGVIVPEVIEDALLRAGGAPPRRGLVVHAGLTHTYGYLFSTLVTPFGYKRARWVDDTLEHGFGLPRGTLGPDPGQGSLLGNVSWFAGRIALRDSARAQSMLLASARDVATAVTQFDYAALQSACVEECDGGTCLHTDLVPLLWPRPSDSSHWLVYSLHTQGALPRLISAFPVSANVVAALLDPGAFGDQVPIKGKYNVYLPEFGAVGRRQICRS